MDDQKTNQIEKLQSFDLGERGGGTQIIIDYRVISPTEYYVMTLGNAPKIREEANDNIKIRFFKLTLLESGQYSVDEFVTVESIANIARLFTESKVSDC